MNYGGDLDEKKEISGRDCQGDQCVKGNKIALEHYYSSCCPDEVFRQIYQGYREACQSRRKLDFDDMILYCYELFVQRKDILEAWQKKFQYILVDEFQDINQLQYDIVRMLQSHRIICLSLEMTISRFIIFVVQGLKLC